MWLFPSKAFWLFYGPKAYGRRPHVRSKTVLASFVRILLCEGDLHHPSGGNCSGRSCWFMVSWAHQNGRDANLWKGNIQILYTDSNPDPPVKALVDRLFLVCCQTGCTCRVGPKY
ncbi:hypothetical protein BDV28DRAFT_11467 [Aspergillus coremiiformis]|uniref:Uncharacterized protein n=1 Tax=Aspergillus coremiiformis TaxID=138285 RepID=A0A5N6ZE58_9EURO|nr:hypothetical protein BDV28DRAFT_11467 [Aspergillus coremiiformis]